MAYKNPEDRRAYYRRRRAARRQLLLSGETCARCGFDDPRALEFHHREPDNRLFSISDRLDIGLAALMAEVAKCDLICANCHAIEHDRGGVT